MTSRAARHIGLRAVLTATAVAGVVGYAIQLSAPRLIPSDAAYVSYSIFWSALYLGGAAISGVQQEIARAARPADGAPPAGRTVLFFSLGAAIAVAAVTLLVGGIVGDAIVPASGPVVAIALSIGLVGYLATSVLTGLYYGLHLWRAVGFAVIFDALLRAALVLTGFVLGWSIIVIAILTAVPFGLAAAAGWVIFGRRVKGAFALDVDARTLVRHALSTVTSTTASGVMISGLPMLIGVTSAGEQAAVTGGLLLAVTITRAPIVIPVIALQSFLISAVFRGRRIDGRRVLRAMGAVLVAGLLLSAAGAALGPPVLGFLSNGKFVVSATEAGLIVLSAVLVAAMCITGPALIAVRAHRANVIGWIAAAALTIGILVLPLGQARILAALTLAPALGLVFHAVALFAHRTEAVGDVA